MVEASGAACTLVVAGDEAAEGSGKKTLNYNLAQIRALCPVVRARTVHIHTQLSSAPLYNIKVIASVLIRDACYDRRAPDFL